MSLRNFIISLPSRIAVSTEPVHNDVVSVASQSDVYTTVGTAPTLPSTVMVTFDSGDIEATGVSWAATIDEVGYYTVEGLLLISNPNTNNGNIKAIINVGVDNVASNLTEWVTFNGYNNYAKFGDILDSVFSAASAYFELEFTMRNVSLTGTMRFFTKLYTSTNQRAFSFAKADNDINFYWSVDGTSARQRQVNWADCLVDTNQHTIKLVYDGSSTTNAGLDRCSLYIDGVLITAGKTLSVNTGTLGDIFNSTSRLAFGTDVDVNGAVSTATNIWFGGDVKDLVVRSSGGTVQLNGFDVAPVSQFHGTYKKYMQPIVVGTKNSSARDSGQNTVNSALVVDISGTKYIYMYYLGASPSVNSDTDETFLSIKPYDNDITSGWAKQLSGGLPVVIFGVGATGKFDAKQVWLRNVMQLNDGTFIGFQLGQSATDTFGIGFNTSSDGVSWTRQNSGNAIYTDGATDIINFLIIWDADDSKYKMIYAGNRLGEAISYAESSVTTIGAQPTFTRTIQSILFGEALSWPTEFKKIGGVYYVWFSKRVSTFSGISDQIVIYKTTDFLSWEFMGAQIEMSGGSYFGHTATMKALQLLNNKWVLLFTGYKNHMNKTSNLGEEFTCIMAAELNRVDSPFAGHVQKDIYPDYVVEHYPLSKWTNTSLTFLEGVSNTYAASINSTPVFTPISAYGNRTLGFVDLTGSQNITNYTPIDLDAIDPTNIAIKLRVEIVTTGTHELFRIGDTGTNRSILITLESGKLRVRISANGSSWAKDWVTTVNISKPSLMNYIDNHIFVGVLFSGGTMTLYNDFVPFTGGQLTKTTDGSITSMYYFNGERVIGNNASVEMRSVSILTGVTSQQFIDLEI